MRRIGHILWELASAVALGFATIFQTKARHDDHWSTPPHLVIEELRSTEAGGDPPEDEPGDGATP